MERYGSIESVLRAEIVELGAALDAEREKVKELKEWQRVVVGTGTDQEAVVRMAATEYTKTAVQCWKDENAKLTAQLATLQAQLAQPIRVCQGCGRVGRDGWVTARYECDELHGSLQCPDCQCIDLEINTAKELAALCTQAQAQLVRWKEALGEWLWNCTNLLGDYHIKTVQDFNEEVNRRIAWLMEHLDHTLPPPMTDEERDRMQKLSEGNAALQADNECKDSLIETLQAQLRQVEHDAETYRKMHTVCTMNLALANNELTTLRQLVSALPVVDVQEVSVWLSPDESGWLVSKRPAFPAGLYWAKFRTQAEADSFRALLAYRATLAQDAGKHHEVD